VTELNIFNPFNAPVFHEETVSSTMDVSRRLAAQGRAHGTVIAADFQEAGRGRIRGRIWEMDRGTGLSFTVLLRYPRMNDIPAALTLRAGIAVSLAIEDFAPLLQGMVKVKWPNDIMINEKKAAGILCEANDGIVHMGIGINVTQNGFPSHLRGKAASLLVNSGQLSMNIEKSAQDIKFCLLEKILVRLYEELNAGKSGDWKRRMEKRLFKKDEQVLFMEGAADSGMEVRGRLAGIGEQGELLIASDSENIIRSFFNGELVLYK
jgi:BirA family biotin operon repressor/biotin-[acetyl-CoA-carboxylase] ligase